MILAYPDTLPEWWTYVIEPSPRPDAPGDYYEHGTEVVMTLFGAWKVEWIPLGDEESKLEREHFRWRPLGSPVDWLD